ncbi:MAG: MFS transporter [Candidatus Bathyarchaeota archaeon]|nr:MAG: MFS transporter [Candidatus Bathyarchaeota archaeon]
MAKKSVVGSVLLQRDFLAVFINVVNAFSWYFPLYLFLQNTLGLDAVAFGVQYVAVVCSALVGTALVKRSESRDPLLTVWMLLGIFASISMVGLETFGSAYVLLVSFLLGISLGLGFPSCLAYFGDYSTEENRGWLAGITFFGSSLCIFFIGLLLNFSTLSVGALILGAWRGIGLFLFLLIRSKQDHQEKDSMNAYKGVSYKSVLLDRTFLLYVIPWIMFCLINFVENPVVDNFFGENVASFIPIAEFGIGSLAALIGGRISDSVGRKPVIIFGFITLGIGYAVLGLLPSIIISWYLYIILDGIAWGIFLLMFYMIIWSELAQNQIKDKYYLIGLLPFLISSYMQILFTPYAGLMDISAAFSLASFFLFLAVFPVLLAPETLPEKNIELKRLRKYLARAAEIREEHGETDSA